MMSHAPGNDDLASICSSLSSDDGVRGAESGGTNEHLVDLLTRPRSRGGYGGRLNYTDFSTLAQSLGWSSEDMDDCWYDIMMGEPSAEAVDMSRVAECVCSYCLASPLPLLKSYKFNGAQERPPSRASASSCASSFNGVEEVEGALAKTCTPPRPPTPPHANMNEKTTVVISPPSPVPPSSPQAGKKGRGTTTKKNTQETQRTVAGRLPRYAVETASSERKKLPSASPPPPSRRHLSSPRTPSKSPSGPPGGHERAASQHASGTVFFRLYENGMEQQRKRRAAKSTAAEVDVAECTFRPKIQPYPLKERDTAEGRVLYNKPTKSYFAKLVEEEETCSDVIAKVPETPRVTYHPAPGPSSDVPAGYVEGVARLRRYVASRSQHADFKSSLRDPVCSDVDRLMDAPILRLPVTVEGVAETVDVRLASASRCPPSRQQQQPQNYNGPYSEAAGIPARASTPRRSPSALVRYKEHPAYH
ncbi:hypothetical protein ABB37_08220 [Leptomonas pyrrhocoris]|uniref:Uncharacterized protein n=1 Tax=Leptomonas pyrrhocoris TaxID=157538 RepID=A0A0N0VDH4_LEPPY|nr:hypothetical protein ABB37_08220 [Leptomonas pyrrhocoris]KPA75652.1 hypothetical protein ABB37_08220 [Leptomonas pyrrhocoris]|eukprot:XP_015654091.1 hypothetical protein ABB37_08220 [Leptomonas pyrrhocoris]